MSNPVSNPVPKTMPKLAKTALPKIFISVASFVDPYLIFTITGAIKQARHPERLVFGVVDQHPENRRAHLQKLELKSEVRYIHVHPVESRGVCWARALVQSLFHDEPFYLQIDSHTYFEAGWDETLMAQWNGLTGKSLKEPSVDHSYLDSDSKFSAKPIISVYPYGFEFENEMPVVKTKISGKTTLVLRPKPNETLTPENPVLHFRAEHVFERTPQIGFHLAGGFIFCAGAFVNEIPYDSRLYFHGEEQSLALRAFTHGWDIFHLPEIPLYHLYKRPESAHVAHHWHKSWDQQRDYAWHELQEKARLRLSKLVYEQADLGAFGLGTVRTLEDFAQLSGIDYRHHHIDFARYQR